MNEKDGSELQGVARTDLLFRREALRRYSASSVNTLPPAVEATLASISAEVMEEAIARRSKPPRSGGFQHYRPAPSSKVYAALQHGGPILSSYGPCWTRGHTMNFLTKLVRHPGSSAVLAAVVATGALALGNHLVARRTERKHPPEGSLLVADGVRLHYSDRGEGSPVVLIHGDMVSGDDWNTSGVAELLLQKHRVIIFDRPGFGHSERPRGHLWTANQQADLLHKALQQLGIERPVVVGHSWGTIVALALAEHHQADTAGLVLLSGYYVWTLRPDVLLAATGAIPIVGDMLRYTVSPLLAWLQMPLLKWAMFSPAPVTPRFKAEYSTGMAVRPSQLRAEALEGALMIPAAITLRGKYKNLKLPVHIMAGEGDRVVFKRRSRQLRDLIKGSVLQIVPGAGHMVHYLVPQQVARAVERVIQASPTSTLAEQERTSPTPKLAAA